MPLSSSKTSNQKFNKTLAEIKNCELLIVRTQAKYFQANFLPMLTNSILKIGFKKIWPTSLLLFNIL